MKISKKIWGIGLLAFLLMAFAPGKSKAQDITEQDFYDNLAPYGTWVSDPQYGDVWVPDVDSDFRPYATDGHWVLTEYGNTWVSDYPWGWATFHYGRWRYDDYYGWEWIPGYEWAPAWVSWRHGGGYYGWAPLMPGISLSLSFTSGYHVPDNYWVCAPAAYINRPNIYNYYMPYTRTVTIIHHTTIINNTYSRSGHRYIAGPGATDIQRYTHHRPQVYTISNTKRPGAVNVHNNTVNIFRPAVKKAPGARPVRVVDAAAYKRQNPAQSIAHRGSGGATANNHANAAKLATVARGSNNNKIVHVNPVNNNRAGHSAQPAGKPQQSRVQPAAVQPRNRPQQPAANPAQPAAHRGRPENRPGITPQGKPVTPPANAQGRHHERQQPAQAQPQPAQHAVQQPAVQQHRGQQHRQQQNPAMRQPAAVQPQSTQPTAQQQQMRQQRQQQRQGQQQVQQQRQAQQAQQQQMQQQRQAQQAQQQQMQQQRQAQQAQQQQVQQQRQAQQAQQQQMQQQRQAQQAQQQQVQQQRQAQQAQQQQMQQQRAQQQRQAQPQQMQQQRQQRQIQQQPRQAPPQRQEPKPDDHKQQ